MLSPGNGWASTSVACIFDELSANGFEGCFAAHHLEPRRWREQFEEAAPEIFFCESAWHGLGSGDDSWRGRIPVSNRSADENRVELLEILAHCRALGVPSVFWNKEDPHHFEDRTHDFVATACEFDYIFTTAEECVDRYNSEYGRDDVRVLPFATNPTLFNPVDAGERSDRMVFAGSWYAQYEERRQAMETIFDGLLAQGFELEIYDRFSADRDPLHQWPRRFAPWVKPAVPHTGLAEVYKSSRFGLNFNTVTSSPTMFSRRVFELMSCRTLVVSNYSSGMERMFGDAVVFADCEPDRLAGLASDEIDALRDRALLQVLREHTYEDRWQTVLSALGYASRAAEPDQDLTIVAMVDSADGVQEAMLWHQQHNKGHGEALLLIAATEAMPATQAAQLPEICRRRGAKVAHTMAGRGRLVTAEDTPLATKHFLAVRFPGRPRPPLDWYGEARWHLRYMNKHLIVPAPARSDRFTLGSCGQPDLVLGRAELLPDYLSHPAATRQVYRV